MSTTPEERQELRNMATDANKWRLPPEFVLRLLEERDHFDKEATRWSALASQRLVELETWKDAAIKAQRELKAQ